MIGQSGEALTTFSSDAFVVLTKTLPKRINHWLRETNWNVRGALVCVAELALVALSFLATASFFDGSSAGYMPPEMTIILLPLALALRGIAFQFFEVCDRSFRYAGIADEIAIAKAVGTSSFLLYFISLLLKSRIGVVLPGRLFLGDAVALFLLLSAFHFCVRIYNYSSESLVKRASGARRVVIIGAGDAGASVLKELLDSPRSGITPVALIDDDPIKKGTRICGVPVAGGVAKLSDILFAYQGSEVLICIPSATQSQRQRILATCLKCGVPVRTLPSLDRLVLIDKSENSLFYCHLGLREAFPALEITPILADVTDCHSVREAILREEPDFVFHAAAYKHVGMMELYPEQAIRNNVLGTQNVLMASVEAGVKTFVNVSTDKAVNPLCFMGLSKKLTELLVKEISERYGLRYMNVRFGNVAGSTGSVLRIFSEQIKKGQPIRITDPQATRYFMSIPEAVSLILCAASMGNGGETFIFNMGTPVNIYELARALTLFAGVVPGEELPIQFTGLKEGEKINEELYEDWEVPEATPNPHVFRLIGTNPLTIEILPALQRLQSLLAEYDQSGLLECLDELVPSFARQRSHFSGSLAGFEEEKIAVIEP